MGQITFQVLQVKIHSKIENSGSNSSLLYILGFQVLQNVQDHLPETSPFFICTNGGCAEQLLASFLVLRMYNFRSIGFFFSNAIRLLQMIINTVSTLPSLSELRMCIVEGQKYCSFINRFHWHPRFILHFQYI